MTKDFQQTIRQLVDKYPQDLRPGQLADVDRMVFHVSLAAEFSPENIEKSSLMDIGGGIGLFSMACAAVGFGRTILVDDFSDPVNKRVGNDILGIHRSEGVEVFPRDVVKQGIADIAGSFEVITSFDSMEHWHNSPKRLFAQVVEKLVPGGVFILGVPNCANIRKRFAVPLGLGKWSPMSVWYEEEEFRGHVREPDVADLHYIARDMGLEDVRIMGRNWLGTSSSKMIVKIAARLLDPFLRIYPPFCSDIYLIGRKKKH